MKDKSDSGQKPSKRNVPQGKEHRVPPMPKKGYQGINPPAKGPSWMKKIRES